MKTLIGTLAATVLLAGISATANAAGDPASAYCEQQGGKVVTAQSTSGDEAAMCELPDGTLVDAWEHFRDGQKQPAGAIGMADPSAVYCEEQGGTVETVTNSKGAELALCNLDDGTVIETWSFYRNSQTAPGAGAAGN